jgi:hypothetical protein
VVAIMRKTASKTLLGKLFGGPAEEIIDKAFAASFWLGISTTVYYSHVDQNTLIGQKYRTSPPQKCLQLRAITSIWWATNKIIQVLITKKIRSRLSPITFCFLQFRFCPSDVLFRPAKTGFMVFCVSCFYMLTISLHDMLANEWMSK